MKTKIIETSDTAKFNWGKFLIGRFDHEWEREAGVSPEEGSLLRSQGWGPDHILVMDLSVGHAAMFLPSRSAKPEIDIRNTGIYFCPLFSGFLEWVYQQDLTDLDALPDYVELEPVFELRGPSPGEYKKVGG